MSEWDLKYHSLPNRWISVQDDPSAALTYVPLVNPAPLVVSTDGLDPVLASLEVVITNATTSAIAVSEIDINIPVGTPPSLTQSTASIHSTVGSGVWTLSGPTSPVTDGIATYALTPADGHGPSISVGPGDVIVVQVYQIETNDTPGTATVGIQETLGDGTVGTTSFAVTTFPAGFYFNALTVTALSGSDFVPVAQVPLGTNVTLFWNASVVDVASVQIFQSTAAGQQTFTPTALGEWTPPTAPLLDTVFTVQVTTTATPGGVPLTASLSTSVSVQTPALVASTITVNGVSTLTGQVNAGPISSGAITTPGVTVNGALGAQAVTTGTLSVTGDSTLTGVTVNGTLTANQSLVASAAQIANALTVSGLCTLNAGLNVNGLNGTWGPVTLFIPGKGLPAGTYTASTDGILIGVVSSPGNAQLLCGAWIYGSNQDGIQVQATGGNFGAFDSNGNKFQGPNQNSFTLPVRKGTQFSMSVTQSGNNQGQAPTAFYWCPIGYSTNAAETVEWVGEAPPGPEAKLIRRRPIPKGHLIRSLADLIERMTGRPIPVEQKEELLDLLSKLNVDACEADEN